MDANGQIYFAPEGEIPEEDIKRLHAAEDAEERLQRSA
jgi:hypothetical protein